MGHGRQRIWDFAGGVDKTLPGAKEEGRGRSKGERRRKGGRGEEGGRKGGSWVIQISRSSLFRLVFITIRH
jgi:hypothetical protein